MSTNPPQWDDPTLGDDPRLRAEAMADATTSTSPISEGSGMPRSMSSRGGSSTGTLSAQSAGEVIGAARTSSATDPAQTRAAASGARGRAASAAGSSAASTGKVRARGPRRVRLAVARVDPWSVMKLSFLLSVAAGIAAVVLTAVVWLVLSSMGVFEDVDGVLQSLQTNQASAFSIKDYVGFPRVVSLSVVLAVANVFLMTAIATVLAFLYNICSALVGGLQLTLTDD